MIVGAWLPPGIVRPDMISERRLVVTTTATDARANSVSATNDQMIVGATTKK